MENNAASDIMFTHGKRFLGDGVDEGFAALAVAVFKSMLSADDAFDYLSGKIVHSQDPELQKMKGEELLRIKKENNLTWDELGHMYGKSGSAIRVMVSRKTKK